MSQEAGRLLGGQPLRPPCPAVHAGEEECGNICMVLVQNKVDMMDSATMEASEVEFLARKLKLKLYRMCVKDDLNVSEVFQHLGAEFNFSILQHFTLCIQDDKIAPNSCATSFRNRNILRYRISMLNQLKLKISYHAQ